jgi:hypothetical protein
LVALAVAAIAATALSLTRHPLHASMSAGAAVRTAMSNPGLRGALSGTHWDRVTVSPVDDRIERVSFFGGGRILAEVSVARGGKVLQVGAFARQRVPYGNWLAYQPAVLIGLSALFVLSTAVAPLRRMRNLDVAAALTLLAPVLLMQAHYVGPSALAALPGLGYLMFRCLWAALAPPGPVTPSMPLLHAVTSGWETRRRIVVLRLLLVALGLVFVMVGLSSPGALDVVYAVMEGATKILHGVLPYGRLGGDVIHGDTYPLLSYVVYVPLAGLTPVNSTWDSADLGLAAAVVAAMATAWGLFRMGSGRRWPGGSNRSPEARERGLVAALAWLSYPPLLITVSSGTTDVALAAMLLAALALWRRPALATGLLAAGGWLKLAPLVLLPIRLSSLTVRQLGAAALAILAVSTPLLILLLVLGGTDGPGVMIHALSFQFSRGSPQSLWAALGIAGLQPLGQAAVLGVLAGAAVRLRRDRSLAEDHARVAALSAAVLIGLQLSADYWAFLYVIWVVPLLCVSLYRSVEVAHEPLAVPVFAGDALGRRGALAR